MAQKPARNVQNLKFMHVSFLSGISGRFWGKKNYIEFPLPGTSLRGRTARARRPSPTPTSATRWTKRTRSSTSTRFSSKSPCGAKVCAQQLQLIHYQLIKQLTCASRPRQVPDDRARAALAQGGHAQDHAHRLQAQSGGKKVLQGTLSMVYKEQLIRNTI